MAVSTMEAENIALSQSMRNLLPLRFLTLEILNNLQLQISGSWTRSTMFEDNNGALTLATTPRMTPRSRHIAVKYHFFRDAIRQGIAHIKPIPTREQLADIFTKGLSTQQFECLRKKLMGW